MVGRDVTIHGPLFDGRASMAVRAFCRDFTEDYAASAAGDLRRRVSTRFKRPTGRYASQVRSRRLGPGVSAVTSNSPYGPWLEGASSRNRKSSFKGYHQFGWLRQRMEQRAETVANVKFQRYLRRMS